MDMKEHILTALQEEFIEWEELLAGIDNQMITLSLEPSHWSVKDIIVHLYAWQQRTLARMEAALHNHPPEFPAWPADLLDDIDKINNWIYETYSDLSWQEVYPLWRGLYRQILDVASKIPERDLLDTELYSWLQGHSPGDFLIATYHHHLEHYQDLLAWLDAHR